MPVLRGGCAGRCKPSGVVMDGTIQGVRKKRSTMISSRRAPIAAAGRRTTPTALHDGLQAVWDDGDRVFTRQLRQDGRAGPQQVLVARLAAEHPSRASLDRFAHEYALRDELDSAW